MILDGALIRRRRQDLSMSQRELSQRLAVSPIMVVAAEEGTNDETLSLGVVASLAETLAVEVPDLFLVPDGEPSEPNSHTQAVGSLLAEVRGLVAVEAIAEAVDVTWTKSSPFSLTWKGCSGKSGWCFIVSTATSPSGPRQPPTRRPARACSANIRHGAASA